jgi:hypothetical protein
MSKPIHITFPPDELAAIEAQADRELRTVQNLIRYAVRAHMARIRKPPQKPTADTFPARQGENPVVVQTEASGGILARAREAAR